MTQRRFAEPVKRGAYFSPCRTWRYSLFRMWDESVERVVFVGLNPSTADETKDDPTIRRCMDFARRWGYGGIIMLNLFAFRATKPEEMKAAADPVGPLNDQTISFWIQQRVVVCAWGVHGGFRGRGREVRRRLRDPDALLRPKRVCILRETRDGHPSHPLYLPATMEPVPWGRW